jgi:hypothetical protein
MQIENCIEISSHPSQNGYYQVNKKQVLARMQGKRNTYTLLMGMLIRVATVEISTEVPQKAKSRTAI